MISDPEDFSDLDTTDGGDADEDPGVNLVLVARLVEKGTGREYDMKGSAFTFGRGLKNDLPAGSPCLSRRHGRITKREDGYYLEDLQSECGTWVGDSLVEGPVKLKTGDVIRVQSLPGEPMQKWSATFQLWYRAVADGNDMEIPAPPEAPPAEAPPPPPPLETDPSDLPGRTAELAGRVRQLVDRLKEGSSERDHLAAEVVQVHGENSMLGEELKEARRRVDELTEAQVRLGRLLDRTLELLADVAKSAEDESPEDDA